MTLSKWPKESLNLSLVELLSCGRFFVIPWTARLACPSLSPRVCPNSVHWVNQSVSSVIQSCLILCNPMDCSTQGLLVHHQLLEFTQTHVHWLGDAIQPAHPLLSASPPAFNLSQHQGLFKWEGSSHQVAKGLEFQLQHQSFQWTPRTDLL